MFSFHTKPESGRGQHDFTGSLAVCIGRCCALFHAQLLAISSISLFSEGEAIVRSSETMAGTPHTHSNIC